MTGHPDGAKKETGDGRDKRSDERSDERVPRYAPSVVTFVDLLSPPNRNSAASRQDLGPHPHPHPHPPPHDHQYTHHTNSDFTVIASRAAGNLAQSAAQPQKPTAADFPHDMLTELLGERSDGRGILSRLNPRERVARPKGRAGKASRLGPSQPGSLPSGSTRHRRRPSAGVSIPHGTNTNTSAQRVQTQIQGGVVPSIEGPSEQLLPIRHRPLIADPQVDAINRRSKTPQSNQGDKAPMR